MKPKQTTDILSYFPRGRKPRDVQVQILKALEDSWDDADVFVVSAAVASGKSNIAKTLANWRRSRGCAIITPTKILVDQYAKDFSDIHVLRAKADYFCETHKVPLTKIPSIKGKRSLCNKAEKCGGCDKYRLDLAKARSPFVNQILGNYFIYMAHQLFRETVVIDECFPGDTFLKVAGKSRKIKSIFKGWKRGEAIYVESYNTTTDTFELKKVTYAWERKTSKRLVKILSGPKKVSCTENHKLLTQEGYKKAIDITKNDLLVGNSNSNKGLRRPAGDTLQVVIGSILGDGYWRKDPHTLGGKRLSIRHGLKQLDYLNHKASILGVEAVQSGKSGYTGEVQYVCNSNYMDDTGIQNIREAIKHLNEYGLAIWFQDDGSTSQNNSSTITSRFHTESWEIEDIKAVQETLLTKWGIETSLRTYKKGKYNYLQLNKDNTSRLFNVIAPFTHPSMGYKLKGECKEEIGTELPTKPTYLDSRLFPVTQVEIGEVTEEFVYDIEVEDNHNFIVTGSQTGRVGIVAHNCHQVIDIIRELSTKKWWDPVINFPTWVTNREELHKWLVQLKERGQDEYIRVHGLDFILNELEAKRPTYLISIEKEMYGGKGGSRNKTLERLIKMVPLDLSKVPPFLWPSSVKKIVLMSGTVSIKDVEQMGLAGRRIKVLDSASPITPDRRPVYFPAEAVNMSYRQLPKNIEPMMELIRDIAKKNHDSKGIIHTTYALNKKLQETFGDDDRFLFHNKSNKTKMYNFFRETEEPKILVASGMYEGIDLAGPEYRWQIIAKVPWPSLADPAIKHLAEKDPEWYTWECFKDLLQACGRICRGPDDYGETIILDSTFKKLWNGNVERRNKLIPKWFRDSVEFL